MIPGLALLVALFAPVKPSPESPQARLSISSDSLCPSVEAVREALSALSFSPPQEHRITVSVRAGATRLSVDFSSPGQGRGATRDLPSGADCQARAEQAAVVIAAWLGEPAVERLAAPVLAAPPLLFTIRNATPTPVPGLARKTRLGLAALASLGEGWTPSVQAELARMPVDTGFGWCVALQATGPRHVEVGGGTSRWVIASAFLLLRGRLRVREVTLEGDIGPVASLAAGWGDGYEVNHTDAAGFWGAATGLRVARSAGRVQPWIELRGLVWPFTPRVRTNTLAGGAQTSFALPRVTGQLALGLSFAFD